MEDFGLSTLTSLLRTFTLVGVEPHYLLGMDQILYRWATVYDCIGGVWSRTFSSHWCAPKCTSIHVTLQWAGGIRIRTVQHWFTTRCSAIDYPQNLPPEPPRAARYLKCSYLIYILHFFKWKEFLKKIPPIPLHLGEFNYPPVATQTGVTEKGTRPCAW